MNIQDLLTIIASRHSVGAKHQCAPGPSREELELLCQAALKVPCHEAHVPVRYCLIESREALADLFERSLEPGTPPDKVERARSKALKAPSMLAIIETHTDAQLSPVLAQERLMSIGSSFQNVMLGLTAMGYVGKIVTSRPIAFDNPLFDVATEKLHAFIMIGRPETPILEERFTPSETPVLSVF